MKKMMFVVIAMTVLLMGCGKEEIKEDKKFYYSATNVESVDELLNFVIPVYQEEYEREFGVDDYSITWHYDELTRDAYWYVEEYDEEFYAQFKDAEL